MSLKSAFPLFVNHPGLVYVDNAATVQKPAYVLDEVNHFLTHSYANIHRGMYPLSIAAEDAWDEARQLVAEAIGARSDEVVFTAHATHASNLIAQGCVLAGLLGPGDIIVVGISEHHANSTPWQAVADRVGATIVYLGIDQETRQYDRSLLNGIDLSRLKVVALSLVSNVTGQIIDTTIVKELSKKCQTYVVMDLSQAIPHDAVDVTTLGADFAYFTGHKLGALTGIGVLWGKKECLERLEPIFVGGGAIQVVTTNGHTYQPAPDKFEPGTPNVVGAVSLRAAFQRIARQGTQHTGSFQQQLASGYAVLHEHEARSVRYACRSFAELQQAGKLHMVGSLQPNGRYGVFTWSLPDGKANALGRFLGDQQICIRTGAHCTHPLHALLAQEATARMSLWAYNDLNDLQTFFAALRLFLERS